MVYGVSRKSGYAAERKRHDTGTGRRGHRDFQTVLRKMGAGGLRYNSDKLKKAL